MPSGEVLYSRDVYTSLENGQVIELIGYGRFIAASQQLNWSAEAAPPGLPLLEPPYCLHRISVDQGDFEQVETDLRYVVGDALRPDLVEKPPLMGIRSGPPPFMLGPLERARSLRGDVEDALAGRLPGVIRDRVAAATVFIEATYQDKSTQFSVTGTGFLVNPRGYIVTNGHVVEETSECRRRPLGHLRRARRAALSKVIVTIDSGSPDQRAVDATVVRRSLEHDLALLKIDGEGLDFLPLESDDAPETLQSVIAAGYPGGKQLAFDSGTPEVSFRPGQITAVRPSAASGVFVYEHSAPIEQGSSGGPLVTPHGAVVGVNTFLTGPQQQSRFAIAAKSLRSFLWREAAEGKGPYPAAREDERYIVLIGNICTIWQELDAGFARLGDWTPAPEYRHSPREPLTQETAAAIATEGVETIDCLLSVLDRVVPSTGCQPTHARIREGLVMQRDAVQKALRVIANDPEDAYIHAAIPGGVRAMDSVERMNEYGEAAINGVQRGRTQLIYAFNRVIGRYWSTIDDRVAPPPPLRLVLTFLVYSPEGERFMLNELGNIFLRHRGNRLVVLHLVVGEHVRTAAYEGALVSGSAAMKRELDRVISERGFVAPADSVAQAPWAMQRTAAQMAPI
jgi:S1-C subfamily serine protease